MTKALDEGLSVREWKGEKTARSDRASPFLNAEEMLREALGTKVQVTFRRNKGRIIIEFYSREDLDRILDCLGRPVAINNSKIILLKVPGPIRVKRRIITIRLPGPPRS